MGKKIGYLRVSTAKQNGEMQHDALVKEGCSKIFSDAASGSISSRPGLEQCLEYLREGDTLVVWKSDRLGRSTVDLLKIVDDLRTKQIGFKSLTEDLFDTTTANGKLVFGIFALLAEHERERLQERTRTGLAAARARGRLGGRPKALTGERKELALKALQDRDTNIKELAKALDIGEATLYRFQREMKKAGKIGWTSPNR